MSSRKFDTKQLLLDYGMLLILILLCLILGVATIEQTSAEGSSAGRQVGRDVLASLSPGQTLLLVAGQGKEDRAFVNEVQLAMANSDITLLQTIQGGPPDLGKALRQIADAKTNLDAIACANKVAQSWTLLQDHPVASNSKIFRPSSGYKSAFFKKQNLINITDQTVVIAIIAIGMTLVIITAGIDLSVGSLTAFASIVTAIVLTWMGGKDAGLGGMLLGFGAGILVCGLFGFFHGAMVTWFKVPAFIVTLATMLIVRGLAGDMAFSWGQTTSITTIPEGFKTLGTGKLAGIPCAVFLMFALYAIAHLVMTRTVIGRYIYAVGGNQEAARLSGVPVRRVILFAYTICGLLAGLGGVILTSQFASGNATYSNMLELYVIAAVVVGGTSLMGGQGKILGTLIGALLLAVIKNGMNLLGLSSFKQMMVLGIVVLLAVLLDQAKRTIWKPS